MKVDIRPYRSNYQWLKYIFDRDRAKGNYDRSQALSLLASLTGIPMIALLTFYGEMYGRDLELEESVARIIKYYKYKEIVI